MSAMRADDRTGVLSVKKEYPDPLTLPAQYCSVSNTRGHYCSVSNTRSENATNLQRKCNQFATTTFMNKVY